MTVWVPDGKAPTPSVAPVTQRSVWVPPPVVPREKPSKHDVGIAVDVTSQAVAEGVVRIATQVDPALVRLAAVLSEVAKIRHRHTWLKYGELHLEQVWCGPMFQEFVLCMKVANEHARYVVLHEAVSRRATETVPAFTYCRTCGRSDCWAAVWTLDLLLAVPYDVTA